MAVARMGGLPSFTDAGSSDRPIVASSKLSGVRYVKLMTFVG